LTPHHKASEHLDLPPVTADRKLAKAFPGRAAALEEFTRRAMARAE
jgi:hypothetical protein